MAGGFISGCNIKRRDGTKASLNSCMRMIRSFSAKRKGNDFFISVGSSFGLKPPQG